MSDHCPQCGYCKACGRSNQPWQFQQPIQYQPWHYQVQSGGSTGQAQGSTWATITNQQNTPQAGQCSPKINGGLNV